VGCGHVFCFNCLFKLFNRVKAEVVWFRCPQCNDYILVPPKVDKKVGAAVLWLQLAEGDEPSDTSSVSSGAFDFFFWK
jgi:hypothetical protein